MASALKDCGHAAKRLREPDTSNACPESEAQSHVRPSSQAATTQTALKSSEKAVKTAQERAGIMISSRRFHNTQPGIMRKTSDKKCEPSSSSDDVSFVPLIRITKVACVGPVQTTLPNFPTEIILIVVQYLPPSSLTSLSCTCRNIRNKTGVFIEYLGKGIGKRSF